MSNLSLPLAIDLSTSGNSTMEALVAFGLLAVVALLLLIGKWRVEYRNLPDDQQQHAKALIGQLEAQTPTTLRWRPSELQQGDYGRDLVERALEATPGTEVQSERVKARQVLREISAAWSTGLHALTERVPAVAVRLVTLAGGIAIFGPIAVYAIEWWRVSVQGDGTTFDFNVVVNALGTLTDTFTAAARETLFAFPYVGDIWALAFSLAIITWELLYANPLPTAIVLFSTALLVTFIDWRLRTAKEYRRDRVNVVTIPRVTAALVIIWGLGVAPTAVGSLVDYPSLGATVGVFLALIGFIGLVLWTLREFVSDLRREARLEWPSDPDRIVQAWIVTKRIANALVAVGSVLLAVYIIQVAVNGKLLAFIDVLRGARPEIKFLIAAVGLILVGLAAYRARSAWADLRLALGDLLKDRSIKLFVFGSGMPFLALGLVYFFVASSTDSSAIALAFALLVGFGVRGLYMLLRALRYRASLLESEDRQPMRVVTDCYHLTDADGDTHYLARVNGQELAHRDPDALADAVADAHEDVLDTDVDHIRPSIAKQYARHLRELGIVHIETDDQNTPSTTKKLKTEMERRTYGSLANNNNQMPVDDLRESIGELPTEIVEPELERYQIEGTRNGTVVIDDGYAWVA